MADTSQNRTYPNLLLARKNILELLRQLEHGKDFEPESIENIGDYIAHYGDRILPIISKEMEKISDEATIRKFEYLIEYLENERFIPMLINLLSKTRDNLKLRKSVIRMLKFYGADFGRPPLSTYMEEFNEETKSLSQELIENINSPSEYLFRLLEEFHYLELEDQRNILSQLASHEDPRAFKLFEMMLRTGTGELITDAMDILGRMRNSESLRILNDALIYLPCKYHDDILRKMRKLNFTGIEQSLNEVCRDNVKSAYMGYPMTYGERHILFHLEEGGQNHLLFFEIEEKWGINEGCHAHINLSGQNASHVLENYVEQFYLKEVTLTYAAKIFADAIRKNFTYDVIFPSAFPLMTLYLSPYYLKPCQYAPCKIKLSDSVTDDAKSVLLKESGDLWEAVDFLGWLTEDARFEDIIDRWYKNSKDDEPSWMDDLLVRKVLREIIIPEIELWRERLCSLADFFLNIAEHRDFIPMILALESAMIKDVEVMANLPFFSKMIIESKNIFIYQTGEEES